MKPWRNSVICFRFSYFLSELYDSFESLMCDHDHHIFKLQIRARIHLSKVCVIQSKYYQPTIAFPLCFVVYALNSSLKPDFSPSASQKLRLACLTKE